MPKTDSAPFAYDGLDRVIHEKARLGVLTSLMAHPKGLAFGDLKQLCGLTDGNLSRHLQVLQDAGLVEIIKGYEGNRPHTTCRLTKTGRRRFLDYLAVLEQLVRDAARAAGNVAAGFGARHRADLRLVGANERAFFFAGDFAMQSDLRTKPNGQHAVDLNTKLHVGIIMDGNGRWAVRQGLTRHQGHIAGVEALRRIVEAAPSQGIGTLTLYAFSSDNWRRPPAEVMGLMELLRFYLDDELDKLVRNDVRLTMIGRRDRIPAGLAREIGRAESSIGERQCAALCGSRSTTPRAMQFFTPWRVRKTCTSSTAKISPRSSPARPACAMSISSSAPPASGGCPTSCCGRAPTPNSTSPIGCGPTSMPTISRRRSRASTSASGALAESRRWRRKQ